MITKEQAKNLEKQQVLAMRNIMGLDISERKMGAELGIEPLEDRRRKTMLKFATKCTGNERFNHWFSNRRVPLYERRQSVSYRNYVRRKTE